MDDERAGLRERKKQETRIALSWAAVRLVVERGLDNVRVEDIAAEAGVSVRTFSNYFANKAEAIAARHLDRSKLIAAELRARPAGEPLWAAITNAVLAGFAMGQESATPDPQWLEGIRLMMAEPALQGELFKAGAAAEAEFAAAIAERTGADLTKDVYPRLVAGAVGAAVTVAIQQSLSADPPLPMESILRDVFQRLGDGLA
ncbi:MAG TPA: TetR family transcriptional regulator [Amycolatopsis sp.]|nr:TetR family transcriptional regulator [Amycolatopsis sp.]